MFLQKTLLYFLFAVKNQISNQGNQKLTSEMLSSSGQQAVEYVKGPFIFGLSDGAWLFQKIWEQMLRTEKAIIWKG